MSFNKALQDMMKEVLKKYFQKHSVELSQVQATYILNESASQLIVHSGSQILQDQNVRLFQTLLETSQIKRIQYQFTWLKKLIDQPQFIILIDHLQHTQIGNLSLKKLIIQIKGYNAFISSVLFRNLLSQNLRDKLDKIFIKSKKIKEQLQHKYKDIQLINIFNKYDILKEIKNDQLKYYISKYDISSENKKIIIDKILKGIQQIQNLSITGLQKQNLDLFINCIEVQQIIKIINIETQNIKTKINQIQSQINQYRNQLRNLFSVIPKSLDKLIQAILQGTNEESAIQDINFTRRQNNQLTQLLRSQAVNKFRCLALEKKNYITQNIKQQNLQLFGFDQFRKISKDQFKKFFIQNDQQILQSLKNLDFIQQQSMKFNRLIIPYIFDAIKRRHKIQQALKHVKYLVDKTNKRVNLWRKNRFHRKTFLNDTYIINYILKYSNQILKVQIMQNLMPNYPLPIILNINQKEHQLFSNSQIKNNKLQLFVDHFWISFKALTILSFGFPTQKDIIHGKSRFLNQFFQTSFQIRQNLDKSCRGGASIQYNVYHNEDFPINIIDVSNDVEIETILRLIQGSNLLIIHYKDGIFEQIKQWIKDKNIKIKCIILERDCNISDTVVKYNQNISSPDCLVFSIKNLKSIQENRRFISQLTEIQKIIHRFIIEAYHKQNLSKFNEFTALNEKCKKFNHILQSIEKYNQTMIKISDYILLQSNSKIGIITSQNQDILNQITINLIFKLSGLNKYLFISQFLYFLQTLFLIISKNSIQDSLFHHYLQNSLYYLGISIIKLILLLFNQNSSFFYFDFNPINLDFYFNLNQEQQYISNFIFELWTYILLLFLFFTFYSYLPNIPAKISQLIFLRLISTYDFNLINLQLKLTTQLLQNL